MAYVPYEKTKKYDNTPRRLFTKQRYQAIQRGIEWNLSFDEWLAIWGDKLSQRGRGRGQLVMARIEDTGPYAVWNVYLEKAELNTRSRNHSVKQKYPSF